MPVIMRVLRNAPGSELRSWLERYPLEFSDPPDWGGVNGALVKPLNQAISALNDATHESIRLEAERTDRMASDAGQTALLAVASEAQKAELHEIGTRHGRSLRMLCCDLQRFQHAEEIAFFENSRRGRTWDGFRAPANLKIGRDPASLTALEKEIRKFFREGPKIKVEVFDRSRVGLDGNMQALIQVAVHREGLPDSVSVFQGDELGPLIYKPVLELGFTYEPAKGVIEVVAQKKARREELVKIFARTLLGHVIEAERIPPRRYDLSIFMADREFDFDPEDGIVDVRLRLVRFATHDDRAFVTIEARSDFETVHEAARREFGERSPFREGNRIVEAVLSVRFRPDRVNPRGRTIAIKLRDPNGCDLKDKTDKERLLGEKYLRRWSIAEDLL
ncbi:MAG: hypothetical protein CVT81_00400 [Alphaproteobacteria bacterium HGW-Alphaproteobacteria-3]|nr:MAG: hypothetical protein CVT81_00400 [Alphaproteobacteria bacterium HGW-Alphaproteobacteria-3]